jgi:hypothetical protein
MKKIAPLHFWKIALYFLATWIGMASLFYVYKSGKKIAREERKKVVLLTEAISEIVDISLSEQNLEYCMKVIENNEIVPVLMVDKNDNIIDYKNLNKKKIDNPGYIKRKLARMKKLAAPIEIIISDDTKHYLYYGKSTILNELSYITSFLIIAILLVVSGIVLDIILITSG